MSSMDANCSGMQFVISCRNKVSLGCHWASKEGHFTRLWNGRWQALTSKLDCKEIKINKIKERLAIQSPGNLEKSVNFKWFIAGIWGWLVEVGTVKGLTHAQVWVCFLCSVGLTPKALVTLGKLYNRRSSLAFMFEALELYLEEDGRVAYWGRKWRKPDLSLEMQWIRGQTVERWETRGSWRADAVTRRKAGLAQESDVKSGIHCPWRIIPWESFF